MTCDLKVILLCKGRGADASSYRPNRDESQWWSRRDALVRCVASFLFGPHAEGSKKELVMLFDDDLARIHMTKEVGSTAIPTERTIVRLWKQAATHINKPATVDGISCRIVFDPLLQEENDSSSLPTGLDSKREVLEYLQQQCSFEFLRNHGLNSQPAVILRKTNKKALMKVWNLWRNEVQKKNEGSSGSKNSGSNMNRIVEIYSTLLQPSEPNVNVIAGTLHETFEELPCYGFKRKQGEKEGSDGRRVLLCFFLGAVRDMGADEYKALEKICQKRNLPQIGFRLGSVPEFTSKILSIVSFHHSQGVLRGAIDRLVDANGKKPEVQTPNTGRIRISSPPSCLHVLCTIPMSSEKLTVSVEARDRLHWCLVRVVVCTLWRSRLVSSSAGATSHQNSLTLIFDDGVAVVLAEEAFVPALAEKHQAAPSEYQILTAIQEHVASVTPNSKQSKKSLGAHALETIMTSSPIPVTCIIDAQLGAMDDVTQRFYSADNLESADRAIFLVLELAASPLPRTRNSKCQFKDGFFKACTERGLPVAQQAFVTEDCEDWEASTIIAAQHFFYQNRFLMRMPSSVRKSCKKRKR